MRYSPWLLLVPLLLFVLGTLVVRFTVDDWCNTTKVLAAPSLPAYVIEGYATWSGRFTLWVGIGIAMRVPFAGLSALLAIGITGWAGWRLGGWMGIAAALTLWCAAPALIQALYWSAGVLNYGLSVALGGGLIVGLVDRRPADRGAE